jgi:xanthine dehydrogenase YagR molybdenum-binding subunit
LGDTNFPQASGSGGSHGAASSGSALFDACNKSRAKLAELAGMDPDAARFGDGRIEAAGQSRPLIDRVGPDGVDADGEIRPGATSTEFS